ncbi:sugar ABC transporter ATP-binding protein [Christensenella tenuis]|uniref:Sugar ABC transporter ATP-binding protein n=1 Tax=Christensenella tenuis TaxID=2763033 RepID=A0ABR7EBP4_9FIRM|nr:sugar ABC transporter ATP-binding protein [Christensenella tenuis]MBC5647187.1 sugar ABC transporter ATP-binding protein [Christensenella tenuis]
MESNRYLLQMKGVTKRFPGVLALNNVDLELYAGEVLALLGENGAGKSTLIKILSGAYNADEGEILIDGEVQNYHTPREANDQGVSIIYQELNYLNDLTVAENIFLNRWPRGKSGQVDWKKLRNAAREILDMLEVDIPTGAYMRDLSVAEKQLVEIAKALSQKMKILVMDEPTSALSEKEAEKLMKLVAKLRDQGTGIIFISHRLDELFQIADRVQVMRDGERVGVVKMKEAQREELIRMMVGREVNMFYPKREVEKKQTVLKVKGLTTDYLKDISFEVKAGEILGVFGLMGSGRTEMAQCIFGTHKIHSGEIYVDGTLKKIRKPADAIASGIAYVTAERKKDGLILIQSVRDNIMTASVDKYSTPFRINHKKEKEIAVKWKEKFAIKTPDLNTVVNGLSGGNQQKVVLAKWLATDPKVLILNEPTRGIDVGAKTEIYKLMEDFCEKGLGVVMISSELPEILQLADRVMVMCEGKATAEFARGEMNQEKLMHGAIGEV